jgi:hypothetical protein
MAMTTEDHVFKQDPRVALRTLTNAQRQMASLCAPEVAAACDASLTAILSALREAQLGFHSVGIWENRYSVCFVLPSGYTSHMYQRDPSHTEWGAPHGSRDNAVTDTSSAESMEHLRTVLSELKADPALGPGRFSF